MQTRPGTWDRRAQVVLARRDAAYRERTVRPNLRAGTEHSAETLRQEDVRARQRTALAIERHAADVLTCAPVTGSPNSSRMRPVTTLLCCSTTSTRETIWPVATSIAAPGPSGRRWP